MANPNAIIADALGLQTQPNELTLPTGALTVAENMEITRDGVAEVARGHEDFSANLPDFRPEQLLVVGGVAYLNLDGGLWYFDEDQERWLRKQGDFGTAFTDPSGSVVVDGVLYVTSNNDCVVAIDLETGARRILAGRFATSGSADGIGDAARFSDPQGICSDGANLYVVDRANKTIRKIVIATGQVSTLAGTAGVSGSADGIGAAASFSVPTEICFVAGFLFVCDTGNHTIRQIEAQSGQVITVAGSAGLLGTTDAAGSAARFNGPQGICSDGANLYVVDGVNRLIRQITLLGFVVSTIAGQAGVGVSSDGIGTAATFFFPLGICFDSESLFIGDDRSIRKMVLSTAVVTTLAGSAAEEGSVDGVGAAARFSSVYGLSLDGNKLYGCDNANDTIRVIYLDNNYVATLDGLVGRNAKSAGLPSANGVVSPPDGWRIRAAALNGNTYFTSAGGILKSESAMAPFNLAGLPRCLDLQLSLSSAGTPTLLTDTGSSPTAGANQARSYRGVWCKRDANNNLIIGAPSSRFTIVNTAGATRDVSIAVQLPPEITTEHFLLLAASEIVDFGDSVDPGDELQTIFEYFPTSTDIANGSLTIVDNVPDSFRGPALYTNETEEGIAQRNTRPPLGRDICKFRGRLLVGNYTEPHRTKYQMLGTTGITAGMTITIGGVTYTAGTAESVATGTFQVFKSGGGGFTNKGTQALNVEYTAKSLCYIINAYAATTRFYAYYESGVDDAPGAFLIEERGVGGDAFVTICSSAVLGALFSPALPTSGSTYSSVAQRRVNRIRVSKSGEPEAFPDGDELVVGGEDEAIQRIIPLRSSVIVIKDNSVWRLVEGLPGEEPTFLDDTVSIAGRDSAAVLNNVVFFLSNQGFVAVSDNGAQIAGRPVERHVVAGLETVDSPNHEVHVGIGCEQRRIYICTVWDAARGERTCYMFSPIANKNKGAWTRRRLNANAFAVLRHRLLYALNSETGNVLRQRASLRDGEPWYRDYCEEASTINITAIDTATKIVTVTFTSGVDYEGYESGPDMGWKFYDGDRQYLVTGANGAADPTWTLVLNTVDGLTVGEKTIYRPVLWDLEYAPITGGNPLDMKQSTDVIVKAATHDVYAIDFAYTSQLDSKESPYDEGWDDPPPADRVFVPKKSGARASISSNDFGATSGRFVPFNEIRSKVHPQRAMGSHLSPRLSGGTAEGYVGIKALVVATLPKDSNKGRP